MAEVDIVEKLKAAMRWLNSPSPRVFVDRLYEADTEPRPIRVLTREHLTLK